MAQRKKPLLVCVGVGTHVQSISRARDLGARRWGQARGKKGGGISNNTYRIILKTGLCVFNQVM